MGGKTQETNHVKRLLAHLRAVKTWQLLLLLLPLLFITATLLRFDHVKMDELKSAVLAADQANDDAQIAATLTELKEFVFSHIVINITESNGDWQITFGTGPFYLENQYLRAANAAIEQAEAEISSTANPHGNIYAAATAVCKPQAIANGWSWNSPGYLNCMTSELAKYPAGDSLESQITAAIPSTELYRHNYASPVWAPTLAGFAILLCLALIVVIFIRFLIWVVLRLALIFLKNR